MLWCYVGCFLLCTSLSVLEHYFDFDPRLSKLFIDQSSNESSNGSKLFPCKLFLAGEGKQRRALWGYITPGVNGITSSITRPPIIANNFEPKPSLISVVQQSQFIDTPKEDPNLHLSIFLEVCDAIKINGTSSDASYLHLFPFSFKDKVSAWLHFLPSG